MAKPVLTQEGGQYAWDAILLGQGTFDTVCHLLGAYIDPTIHAITQHDLLTMEYSGEGYAPIEIEGIVNNWPGSVVPQGFQVLNQKCSWQFTDAGTVWGGWLDNGGAVSIFYWIFDPPYEFPPGGGAFYIVLNPSIISVP